VLTGYAPRPALPPRTERPRNLHSPNDQPHSIWGWFRTLHETTGINLTTCYDPFDGARFFPIF